MAWAMLNERSVCGGEAMCTLWCCTMMTSESRVICYVQLLASPALWWAEHLNKVLQSTCCAKPLVLAERRLKGFSSE
jgi:hypothetical protein